jgi:hypothetical protein
MATVSRINGVAVNIGFAGTPGGLSITSPAISTNLILQSADESNKATSYRVEDEVGNRVVSTWMDPTKEVVLEMIIKITGLAAVITATAAIEAIEPGDMLTIGACQQQPGLVATNWEVQDSPKVAGTNKDAKKFTVTLVAAPGITGPASA